MCFLMEDTLYQWHQGVFQQGLSYCVAICLFHQTDNQFYYLVQSILCRPEDGVFQHWAVTDTEVEVIC